jgi:hypothetical protein
MLVLIIEKYPRMPSKQIILSTLNDRFSKKDTSKDIAHDFCQ